MSTFVYRNQIGDARPSSRPGLREVLPGGQAREAGLPPAAPGGMLPGHQEPEPSEYDPLAHMDRKKI